jgi:ketosteroid isomerase-like protein
MAPDTERTDARPSEVMRRLIDGVTGRDFAPLADLYAEDTVVTHPHGIPAPTRIEGREAVRKHFAAGPDIPLRMRAENVVMHETADPEVIVTEYDYVGEATTTGRSFVSHNIVVTRVRDGLIVESRDYHDHYAITEALKA